jgi:urease accessory protein
VRRRVLVASTAVLAWLMPAAAFAHPMPGVGDFYAGMLHPLTAIEFLLPLVAIGLLAGQQKRSVAVAMLLATPLAVIAGALLGMTWPPPHAMSLLAPGSMAVLGVLVAASPALPGAAAMTLAAVAAFAIGSANGVEMGDRISALRFIPGVALSGALLVVYGAGAVRRWHDGWPRVAFRVIGSWIAAIGVLLLGLV